jgi:uncharacterized repeat protein (TIGR01451 family)
VCRVVEAFVAACPRADKPSTARRVVPRAGVGRAGVVAALLGILLATFGSHAAQAQTANLQIAKTVSNSQPNVGDTITFTVTLTNVGPDTATNVTVTDPLPAGLTLSNTSASQGTYIGGVWNVGTVDTVNPQTLQLQAKVVSQNQQTNTATITAATPNTSVGNSASATETPQVADLQLTKTVSNATPNVGDTITFTVTLSNAGPSPATNVSVQDQLPAGLTLLNSSPSQGTYVGNMWTVGTVAAGASATLTLQATVISPNPQTNTASVSHSDQFDPNTANNTASATAAPQQADLIVTKTAPPSAHVGDTFNEVVTISNLGPSAATNVQASDLPPGGLTIVGAVTSQGAYNSSTGVWVVGTIAASGAATLTLTVRKTTAASTTNTATITNSDQFDPNTANNTASATTTTAMQSAPTISKSFGASTIPVNGTTSLSFTITNPNGSGNLTGVGFTDSLPAGLVVATPNSLTGSCGGGTITANAGSGSISLSGGSLTAGGSCTFQANVTGTTPGVQNNVTSAVISNEGGVGNAATATLTVTGPPANATSTTLVSSPNPSNVGQAVTFTATVTSPAGTPTGTVSFKDGGTVIGTATLSAAWRCSLPPRSHSARTPSPRVTRVLQVLRPVRRRR